MRCPTRYSCYLTLLSILGFTQAYIIDDQNTAIIQYTPSNFWFPNSPDTRVDHSKLYNSTYTYGLCRTTDGCVIKIPFTGTGIAVYQLLWAAVNATITLDGGSPQLYVRDNACELQAILGCYNSPVYNAQFLANGDHLLEMAFQGYNGGLSDFNLDYIDVNGTAISPSTQTSVPPSIRTSVPPSARTSVSPSIRTSVPPSARTSVSPSTGTSVSPSAGTSISPSTGTSVSPSTATSVSRIQAVVIAGGTVGALAVVLIFVLALIYLLRRPQRPHDQSTSVPHQPTSGITPFPAHSPSGKGITMAAESAHAVWTPEMLNTISSGSGSTNDLGPAGQVNSFERLRYPTQSGPASVAVDGPSPVSGFSTTGAVRHASMDAPPPDYDYGS